MKEFALVLPSYGTVPVPTGLEQISHVNNPVSSMLRIGVTLLIISAIVLALVFLILGAIGWITSGGDKEALQKARKKITFAIVGLVVVLLAIAIVNIIGTSLSTNLFKSDLP